MATLWAACLAGFLTLCTASPSLLISTPNMFHLGEHETVSVIGSDLPGGVVTVTLYLQHLPTGGAYGHQTAVVRNHTPQILKMKVKASMLAASPRPAGEALYVRLTATANKPGLGLPKSTDVLLSLAGGHVFIQTNKPVYTPRETVLVRVFTTDEDTKAVTRPVRIEIKNPQGVTVQRETKPTKVGIFSTSYKLPPIPMFGDWTAVIKHDYNFERSETVRFEVKEYVLPTYQVKITDVNDYIVETTEKITAHIEAKYSFNHHVIGMASVEFRVVRDGSSELVYSERKKLHAGKTYVDLDIAMVKQIGPRFSFPDIIGARLEVVAVVMERSSGHRERAVVRRTVFVKSPYVINFRRTPSNFHPGLSFTLKVDVKHVNGEPAANLPVQFRAFGLKDQGDPAPKPLANSVQDEMERVTDARGRIETTLNVDNDHKVVRVKVQTKDPSPELARHQPPEVKEWTKYESSSQLLVKPKVRGTIEVNRNFQFEVLVTRAAEATEIYYMAISRGRIVGQGVTRRAGGGVFTTITMPITAAMVPSVRLVAWYTKNSGEVVADSTVLEVSRTCGAEVSLSIIEGGYKPGSTVTLRLTAALGASVSLLAVDQAVYFLNKRDVLTREKMFDQLDSRDLGCGGGGGADVHQVFQNAGLSVISNTNTVRPGRRQQETCAEPNNGRRTRRSIQDTVPDPTDCCAMGTVHAQNHTQNSTISTGQDICLVKAYSLPHSVKCVNSFFRCCRKTSDEMYRIRNPRVLSGARSSGDNEGFDVDKFEEEVEMLKLDESPVRKRFPESWLFESFIVDGATGTKDVNINLMDSITTWVFQAVAMSPDKGMCVAAPYNVTVTKQMFIQLDLPYSVIKGEQIEVKATIFNMYQEEKRALVEMGYSEALCSSAVKGDWTPRKVISIPGQGSATTTWPIVPLKVGQFPIRVRLRSLHGREIVEKTITVKHGGVEKTLYVSGMIDPTDVTDSLVDPHINRTIVKEIRNPVEKKHTIRFDLRLPEEAILGSAMATVGVMGEIMGPVVTEAIKGTERWIKLPSGCGEQTMMRLGPTVFASRYLKETDQFRDALDLERKSYENIEKGIRHMYRYRQLNGGFSVWTNRRPSYWLTTFVVKTLSQARRLVTDDPSNVICSASLWILTCQAPDGSFNDPVGTAHRHDLKGRLQNSGKDGLSAFILIGLQESNCQDQRIKAAVRKGRTYLEGIYTQLSVPYDVALVSYALALTESTHAAAANTKLRALSRYSVERNHRYWPQNANEAAPKGLEWRRRRATPVDIETAGYALLTQLKLGHTNYSYSIVAWLLAQRKSGTQFSSTQDTVIALQGLTEYSIKTHRDDLNIDVKVTATNALIDFSGKLHERNKLLLQSTEVTSAIGGDLILEAEGAGVGAYQVKVVYNTNDPDPQSCQFDLTVSADDPRSIASNRTADDLDNKLIIKTCARYRNDGETGMAIMDVGLPTGYVAVFNSLENLKDDGTVDFFETTSRSVIFYIEKITNDTNVCVSFRVAKVHDVVNMKPVGVQVYDYYNPDQITCQTFYHPVGLSSSLTTRCRGKLCTCLASCPLCYDFKPGYRKPPVNNLMDIACNDHDYVYVIETEMVRQGRETTEIKAIIRNVVKKGIDISALPGTPICFTMATSCNCKHGFTIQNGKRYVVMGTDPVEVLDKKGNVEQMYTIDGSTFVSPRFKKVKQDGSPKAKKIWTFLKFLNRLRREGCPA